ncbi:MAG: tetraacyldisaccharide 4'-kinase, partial [Proteobacteria bacterium]|nr:tetraacyldisaccharide 4'-kinase [Pseudomonadota bacterium]
MTGFDLETDRPGIWRRLLARVYGRLIGLRLWLYRTGVLKRFRLPARVVSVGNLTVGGTGKTPAAIFIARSLQARGFKVAVLSRGYKAARRGQVNVVSDGREVLLGPSQAGDEACLMARALPGVPVLSGRNRAALGRYAVERFGTGVLVLDDGFQHLPLERDVDLLLLDAR